MNNNEYISYHKFSSIIFNLIMNVLLLIICLFIFDKGLLGVTVNLDDSLLILRHLFSDPMIYITIIAFLGIFVYRTIKSKKISSIEVISKKVYRTIFVIAIVVGLVLIAYGYLEEPLKGAIWVFIGFYLIGGMIINGVSFVLFQNTSPLTPEVFKDGYLSNKNRLILAIILVGVSLVVSLILMM